MLFINQILRELFIRSQNTIKNIIFKLTYITFALKLKPNYNVLHVNTYKCYKIIASCEIRGK